MWPMDEFNIENVVGVKTVNIFLLIFWPVFFHIWKLSGVKICRSVKSFSLPMWQLNVFFWSIFLCVIL